MSANFFLSNLFLKNFVTFTSETIEFKEGLNSIIGETGSGKSLLLEALYLILGGRGDKKVIRKDSEFALIEATFTCKDQNIITFLESEGFPLDSSELLIKRIIYRNGQNKNFINNMSCNLTTLNSFTKKFVDIVGQFENQKLLSSQYQLQLLDHFSNHEKILSDYSKKYQYYHELKNQLSYLENSNKDKDLRIEFLNYQINEIISLSPSDEEELLLAEQKQKFLNYERTLKSCHQIIGILEGVDEQAGVLNQINLISTIFRKNSDIFKDCQNFSFDIEEKIYSLQRFINQISSLDISTEDYEAILDKLDKYQNLKRKYNGPISSVLEQLKELQLEQENLKNLEFQTQDLEKKLSLLELELKNEAYILHDSRIVKAKELEKKLTNALKSLNMPGSTLKVEVTKIPELGETGFSGCSFIAETNLGEGFFKIKEIASGGELSRILLAVRLILSQTDSISIFLFDEIDTGIGGETANLIGKALKEIAYKGQVIAITHLPQIAQFSDSLLIVNKETNNNNNHIRTESYVKSIYGKNILKEARSMINLQ